MITEQEQEIIDITVQLWNKISALPEQHTDDNGEIRFHVHGIQNIILARAALRPVQEEGLKVLTIEELRSIMDKGLLQTWGMVKDIMAGSKVVLRFEPMGPDMYKLVGIIE